MNVEQSSAADRRATETTYSLLGSCKPGRNGRSKSGSHWPAALDVRHKLPPVKAEGLL